MCIVGGGVDRMTDTCRKVSLNVGRVNQPLILCNCDLFEQPAVSHQHSYVRAEWSANKDKERDGRVERQRKIERLVCTCHS